MNNENISIEGRTRLDILAASLSAGKNGAHIAPSLSAVEICLAILKRYKENDDSIILSKGHGALGYYAAMHQTGLITDEQFGTFEQNGGEFPGQPSRSANNKIEYSSGSLGMGLPYALGVALAKKQTAGIVYAVVGDGELNEGSNWEATALASQYGLENLVVIVDMNTLQSDGNCMEIVGQNLLALWQAHGWHVEECDGHSLDALEQSFDCEHERRPLVVLARTIKGKGVSFMENNNAWHHAILKEDDYNNAVQEVRNTYGIYQK